MSNSLITRTVVLALLFTASARAQLYIDAAGPRNLLFPTKEEKRPDSDKLATKFDSEKKSVTAGMFRMRDSASGRATTTLGLLATIASPNGWDELFKSHTLDVSALLNQTWQRSGGDLWFTNVSGGLKHDNLRIRTTATDPVRDVQSDTGKAALGVGRLFGGGKNGLALSLRFERATNYADLKKVDVGGRPAREGALVRSDTTPIALIYTREFQAGFAADIVALIRKQDGANYSFIGGIYAEYDPTTKGATDHRLGLNLTVKEIKTPAGEALTKKRRELEKANNLPTGTFDDVAAKSLAEITVPWSVFAEWRQPLGSKKADFVTGVAVLFSWP